MLLPIGLAFMPSKYWPETFFHESFLFLKQNGDIVELVSKELNHLVAILHVYDGGLNFMK